jgi:hypothetical protein
MSYTLVANSPVVIRDADQTHIPPDHANRDRQTYQAWLDAGNTPAPAPPPMRAEEAADWLAGGLTVNFTGSSAPLSGKYAVVPPDSDNINAIATSQAYDSNTFPGGQSTVMVSTMDGEVKAFAKNDFKLLVRAIRDFTYDCQLYVMGQAPSLPSNVTSKSLELNEAPPA